MDEHPFALVTGAAHRLGRAFALSLAKQGYAILLHYHSSKAEAEDTAETISAIGVPVFPIQADLAQPDEIRRIFVDLDSRLSSQNLSLKVLVNSASLMPHADIKTLSSAEWDSTFALNLRAPFLLAQQAAQRMTAG